MSKQKILVTGATGRLGRATIEFLLGKLSSGEIAALVRDTAKAADLAAQGVSVRRGDYHDYDSLRAAFSGVEKVFLVSAVPFAERFPQHKNAIDAARAAGVKHIIYTAMQRRRNPKVIVPWATASDIETENYLKNSGLDYTILRNTLYSEAISFYLGDDVLETGVLFPGGAGRLSSVPFADLAEANANLLVQDGHEKKEYTLSASESFSFAEIAGLLSAVSEKNVSYTNISREEFIERLSKMGLSQPVTEFSAAWAEAINQGEFAETENALEKILGRKPTDYKEYFKTVYFPKAKAQV
jgi:NAD(P)H dehydrogenase (quinone)